MTNQSASIIIALASILVSAGICRSQTSEKTDGGCGTDPPGKVVVTLISVEKRYLLAEGVPVIVTVRAENCSAEPVTLADRPFFKFFREDERENGVHSRFEYSARVGNKWPRANKPIVLTPGAIHEFYVDVSALEVKLVASSIDLWRIPLRALNAGDFEFQGAVILVCAEGKELFIWSSNKLIIATE